MGQSGPFERELSCWSGVVRSHVWLPLDVAAQAGALVLVDGAAGEDGVDGGPEVGAGDGEAVAGAAGVELAPVDEAARAVEEEEVGGAGGPVGLGHGLGLVVEVGEAPALAGGLGGHRIR